MYDSIRAIKNHSTPLSGEVDEISCKEPSISIPEFVAEIDNKGDNTLFPACLARLYINFYICKISKENLKIE